MKFGLIPVRSPLLREWSDALHRSDKINLIVSDAKHQLLFSFPPGTEMFHFPGCPTLTYVFSQRQRGIPHARFPYSEIPGSKVVCYLTEAYRTLLRPSSAHIVKPSAVCPYDALPPHKANLV